MGKLYGAKRAARQRKQSLLQKEKEDLIIKQQNDKHKKPTSARNGRNQSINTSRLERADADDSVRHQFPSSNGMDTNNQNRSNSRPIEDRLLEQGKKTQNKKTRLINDRIQIEQAQMKGTPSINAVSRKIGTRKQNELREKSKHGYINQIEQEQKKIEIKRLKIQENSKQQRQNISSGYKTQRNLVEKTDAQKIEERKSRYSPLLKQQKVNYDPIKFKHQRDVRVHPILHKYIKNSDAELNQLARNGSNNELARKMSKDRINDFNQRQKDFLQKKNDKAKQRREQQDSKETHRHTPQINSRSRLINQKSRERSKSRPANEFHSVSTTQVPQPPSTEYAGEHPNQTQCNQTSKNQQQPNFQESVSPNIGISQPPQSLANQEKVDAQISHRRPPEEGTDNSSLHERQYSELPTQTLQGNSSYSEIQLTQGNFSLVGQSIDDRATDQMSEYSDAYSASFIKDLQALWKAKDVDGKNRLDREEAYSFVKELSNMLTSNSQQKNFKDQQFNQIFAKFDDDGDGYLSKQELATLIKHCFPKKSRRKLNPILREPLVESSALSSSKLIPREQVDDISPAEELDRRSGESGNRGGLTRRHQATATQLTEHKYESTVPEDNDLRRPSKNSQDSTSNILQQRSSSQDQFSSLSISKPPHIQQYQSPPASTMTGQQNISNSDNSLKTNTNVLQARREMPITSTLFTDKSRNGGRLQDGNGDGHRTAEKNKVFPYQIHHNTPLAERQQPIEDLRAVIQRNNPNMKSWNNRNQSNNKKEDNNHGLNLGSNIAPEPIPQQIQPRWLELHVDAVKKNEKPQDVQKEKEDLQSKLSPQVDRFEHQTNTPYQLQPKTNLNERSQEWLRKVQERKRSIKNDQEENSRNTCTFRPQTQSSQKSLKTVSNPNYQEMNVRSIESHIERQYKARQRKERAEEDLRSLQQERQGRSRLKQTQISTSIQQSHQQQYLVPNIGQQSNFQYKEMNEYNSNGLQGQNDPHQAGPININLSSLEVEDSFEVVDLPEVQETQVVQEAQVWKTTEQAREAQFNYQPIADLEPIAEQESSDLEGVRALSGGAANSEKQNLNIFDQIQSEAGEQIDRNSDDQPDSVRNSSQIFQISYPNINGEEKILEDDMNENKQIPLQGQTQKDDGTTLPVPAQLQPDMLDQRRREMANIDSDAGSENESGLYNKIYKKQSKERLSQERQDNEKKYHIKSQIHEINKRTSAINLQEIKPPHKVGGQEKVQGNKPAINCLEGEQQARPERQENKRLLNRIIQMDTSAQDHRRSREEEKTSSYIPDGNILGQQPSHRRTALQSHHSTRQDAGHSNRLADPRSNNNNHNSYQNNMLMQKANMRELAENVSQDVDKQDHSN